MAYCPKQGAVLVNIESNSSTPNQIALLNVPASFQVAEKVFYVKYYYDASLGKFDAAVTCPAIYGPAKIYVTDSASDTDCKN
jgi:hypothetical protein